MAAKSFGRYELLELLGRGGMGEVYRAHDTITERTVAVKLLPPDLAEDSAFQSRFRREARTAAALNDPHVVPIHGYGEIEGRLYVDMRLVEGRDLHSLITEEGGRLSPSRAVAIIEQVASALDSAHNEGLVHRDVKPSNILVTDRDFAYLIDFGIARATTDTAMTKTGHMVGTLAYMAPERFDGKTEPSSDIYSLACVLYESLTGERPYSGDSLEQQLAGHLTKPAPKASETSPDLPPALDAVIARGLAKEPGDRYGTASELAEAARAALADTAPKAALDSVSEAPTQQAKLTSGSSPTEVASKPSKRSPGKQAAGKSSAPTAPLTNAERRDAARRKLDQQLERKAKNARRLRLSLIVAGSVAVLAVIAVVVVLIMNNFKGNQGNKAASGTATTASSVPQTSSGAPLPAFQPSAALGANCEYPASQDAASKPVKPPRTGKVPTDPATISASMSTNQGNIGLLLANNESPCTVNSFASLAGQKFFNDTKCHRLTTSPDLAVLQCGDPKGDGTGGPGYGFANEYPTDQYPPNDPKLQQAVIYPRGTLAMAHSKIPNSNGSQFFLVYKDSQLPPDYTVFGKIQDDGLAVLDKIAKGGVAGGGEDGSPALEVTIKSVLLD